MTSVLKKTLNNQKLKWWIPVIVGILIILVISSVALLQEDTSSFAASTAEVVIIDQLEGSYPNQTFKIMITELAGNCKLDVDYYQNDEITVDFFRNLLRNEYRLIILRMHAATGEAMGQPSLLSLFTGEPYT